jgi:hypothetical protein
VGPEQSPLQKTAQAFKEGIPGDQLLAIAKGVWNANDPAQYEAGKQALGNLVVGAGKALWNEPGRIANEYQQTRDAVRRGDIRGTLYHAVGMEPFVGPATQQVATDIAQGNPAAAVGHGGAAVAPFLVDPVLGTAGKVVGTAGKAVTTAANVARDVIEGGVKAAGETAKTLPGVAAGGAVRGAFYGNPILGAKAAVLGKIFRDVRSGVQSTIDKTAAEAARRMAAEGAARQAAAEASQRAAAAAAKAAERTAAETTAARGAGVEFTPEEQALAGHVMEGTEPQEAPAAPPAAPPAAQTTPALAATAPAAPEITPGQAYAESQGYNWQKLPAQHQALMEDIARARANVAAQPEPIPRTLETSTPAATAAEPPAAPSTSQEIAQNLKAEMERSGTLAPAQEAPAAESPFAEAARAKKVDALFNVMTHQRIAAGFEPIPRSVAETFGDKEWEMLARHAGVEPPSETSINALKERLSGYEAAQNIPLTPATTPAEAQTAFEQARTTRTQPAK